MPGNSRVCPTGAFSDTAATALQQGVPQLLPISQPIFAHQPALYYITKPGIAALTLPAPRPGNDDNVVLEFIATTAYAHTITTPAAGDIQDGNAAGYNRVMTFNGKLGANCKLRAYNGVWYVESENGCLLTS
jgi:hypothetical protein